MLNETEPYFLPSSFFLRVLRVYPYGTLRERGSFNPYSSGKKNPQPMMIK
ncbi:hypothetical protein [Anabaena sp. PCC 7108]|nr:hypothetical protein [Anabaena sp. PCC 7108]